MEYVESYTNLEVYKAARQLAKEIFSITKDFPRDEMFSLTDQIRRSSRSIGAQIAEAWAKRLYEKHFVSKLTDADGEQQETQHWIETANDCGYLTTESTANLRTGVERHDAQNVLDGDLDDFIKAYLLEDQESATKQ